MIEPGPAPTWNSPSAPEEEDGPPPAPPAQVGAAELASILAARMCHDFISPASAIVSGVDLLEDPSAQDMREDAMKLIETSARKLIAHLAFTRVAFGGSSSAESFDVRELERLARGVFDHMRADLEWAVLVESAPKPCARTLLNLAQIGGGALPTGGQVRVTATAEGDELLMAVESSGGRLRVRSEVLSGLLGHPLGEGLSGHWVQAYYVHALLKSVGGAVDASVGPDKAVFRARCPLVSS